VADEQDRAELLDDDRVEGPFPPDQPEGLGQYGLTPREEELDEPLEERVLREEPDVLPPDEDRVEGLVDPAPEGSIDLEGQLVADGGRGDDLGALDEGDPLAGDETLRDTPLERSAETPAEEAAVHVEPEV
jgi:hypothetical protein